MAYTDDTNTTPLLKTRADDNPVPKIQKTFPFRQYLLELVFFTYFSAYELVDYVSYRYIYKYGAVLLHFEPNKTNDTSQCIVDKNTTEYQLQQKVTAFASSWQLYFALTSGIPGLFTGVIYGTYSDRIGRRYIMIISTASVCCRAAAYVIAVQWDLSMYYVLPGYILEGVGGSYTTMFLASAAYTADVTKTGASRALRLTLVFVVGGLSDAVGFASFGYAINGLGYRDTFLLIIGVFGLAGVCVFFLPESRSGEHMQKMSFKQYIYRAIQFYTSDSTSNPNRYVYILATLSLVFSLLAICQRSGIELLYLLDSPFCWSNVFVGNFQAISKTLQRFVSLLSIAVLLKFTTEEVVSVLFGITVTASFALEAFAKTDTWMYIVAVLNFPNTPFMILQRTIVSSRTDVDNQGALFASIQVIESVSNTAGTALATLVYEKTVDVMPGAAFLYMFALAAISTTLLAILLIMMKQRKKSPERIK